MNRAYDVVAVLLAGALLACGGSTPAPRRPAAAHAPRWVPARSAPPPPAALTPAPAPAAAGPPARPAEPPALAAATGPCEGTRDVAIFTGPRSAAADEEVQVMVVAEQALDAALAVYAPDGARVAVSVERHDGPPWWWHARFTPSSEGTYEVLAGDGTRIAACDELHVGTRRRGRWNPSSVVWRNERGWDRAHENLFSAWLAHLFDDPLDAQPSWPALHEITRDPARNFLHDFLGLGEDGEDGLRMQPDCADLPYYLRAYFSWKLGLPFGYSSCSRGGDGEPPRCDDWHSNLDPPPAGGSGVVSAFEEFLRRSVGWSIQSGAGRAPAEDERTDLYPTRLSTGTLRPGTVYADPYGHTLVVVRVVPQSDTAGGTLLAVDAQPDGTVARKRFWRGNFLFVVDPTLGSAGFKHFRPILRARWQYRPLRNDEISRHPDYGDYSLEQYEGGTDGFYDRMEDVLSPRPREPSAAFLETIQALDEQIRTRIQSVGNGEEHVGEQAHGAAGIVGMPDGASIFETRGAWEDYATPSRDLRLLIAIDVVTRFPETVPRRPSRFAMPAGRTAGELRRDLSALLAREARARRFEYRRSDGSTWTFTMAHVLGRTSALEIAYNPNDCIETRWGAPEGSAEASTCRRHAPAEQLERMERYRAWFHERRRPARGTTDDEAY